MNKKIFELIQGKQTVFSIKELSGFIKHNSDAYLRNRISFYKKRGIFTRISRGIYSIRGGNYHKFELANKIYSPSYISFFSALYYHKIIFQYQNDVYLAYKKTDIKRLDKFNIILKNLKTDLLFNSKGVEVKNYYSIASRERAFLDTLYIFGETYFDDLNSINWKKVNELVKIYNSRKLDKLLLTYNKKGMQ